MAEDEGLWARSLSGLVFAVAIVMRVYVSSPRAAISPQILAYAEYRIFAALARFPTVRRARVVLHSHAAKATVRCSVAVEDADGVTRVGVTGAPAAPTIDRAAARVGEVMRRRSQAETAVS